MNKINGYVRRGYGKYMQYACVCFLGRVDLRQDLHTYEIAAIHFLHYFSQILDFKRLFKKFFETMFDVLKFINQFQTEDTCNIVSISFQNQCH